MNAAHLAQLLDSFTPRGECSDDRRPADGHQPSLSLRDGDGRVGVTSHTGCSLNEIVSALDLAPSDLASKVAAVSSYTTLEHSLFIPVVRHPPERSRQRWPDGDGGGIWNREGAEKIPYRLLELAAAVAENKPWAFIVDGEHDVDRWWGLGWPATTNPGYGFSPSFSGRNSRIHIRSVAPAGAHA
jgi:hypothetical protein